ncbi:MAG: helix-turn-helix transcriptional regulator [Planctomycetes bacterium]|nr:helix-turn-helix transcriptional regulator [Planctomycetota bacterium]
MPPSDRRARERQQVRERALTAARELIAQHGFEAVTLRKIAAAIDQAPSAIYPHFKGKEELIRTLCLTDFDWVARSVAPLASRRLAPRHRARDRNVLGRCARSGLDRDQLQRQPVVPLAAHAAAHAGDDRSGVDGNVRRARRDARAPHALRRAPPNALSGTRPLRVQRGLGGLVRVHGRARPRRGVRAHAARAADDGAAPRMSAAGQTETTERVERLRRSASISLVCATASATVAPREREPEAIASSRWRTSPS